MDIDSDDEDCSSNVKRRCAESLTLDSLSEDLVAKVLAELDTKDRLRARFVHTSWSRTVKVTGWERINLRFVPDPPRDGLRDEGNLYRRAEARARWLVQQNLSQVM